MPQTLSEINLRLMMQQKELEELAERLERAEERLYKYDMMAAKWGGILIFAFGLGSWFFEYSDKIKTFLTSK